MNLVSAALGVRDLFDAATAADVSVRTGWQLNDEYGTSITVGLTDRDGAVDFDGTVALTQPMASVESIIMGGEGFDSHDLERAVIQCRLDVPSEGDETPDSVVARAELIMTQCRSALRSGDVGGYRAWVPSSTFYLTDSATGHALSVAFSVAVESFT